MNFTVFQQKNFTVFVFVYNSKILSVYKKISTKYQTILSKYLVVFWWYFVKNSRVFFPFTVDDRIASEFHTFHLKYKFPITSLSQYITIYIIRVIGRYSQRPALDNKHKLITTYNMLAR